MNTSLKSFIKKTTRGFKKHGKDIGLGLLVLAATNIAYAQGINNEGLCAIASMYKSAAGYVALIAFLIAGVNALITKVTALTEVMIGVVIICAVILMAPKIINATGLAASCSGV